MKERPILFSSEMVKAILEGRKTQTRRVINPQPTGNHKWAGWIVSSTRNKHVGYACWGIGEEVALMNNLVYAKSRYGKPGDILYVKETFAIEKEGDEARIIYKADRCSKWINADVFFWLASDYEPEKWKPSIFMPRSASRITLEVVNVRVERICDISVPDCIKEGINHNADESELALIEAIGDGDDRHKERFADLWDSINEKRGFGWDVNPWVWVVEFKVVDHA